MSAIGEERSLASDAFNWMLGKACDAAAGAGSSMVKGGLTYLLTAAGFLEKQVDVGEELAKLEATMKEIQDEMAWIGRSLEDISAKLTEALAAIEMMRDELIFHESTQLITHQVNIIDNQFDNLRRFPDTYKRAPPSRRSAEAAAFARELLPGGNHDIDQQLYDIHRGIIGVLGMQGVLKDLTALLLDKLRQGRSMSVAAAYASLEGFYGELLCAQGKGLVLMMEALNWCRAHGESLPTEGLTAETYVETKLGPNIEEQIDVFLDCVNVLVTHDLSLPTRVKPAPSAAAQASFLPADAEAIYRRADFLALSAAPRTHGYALAGRLIGEPSNIANVLVGAGAPAVRVSGDAIREAGTVAHLALDVVHVVKDGERRALSLYPTGEYIEWVWNGCDYTTPRRAAEIAVAKVGLRTLPEPHPSYDLVVEGMPEPRSPSQVDTRSVSVAYCEGARPCEKSGAAKVYGSFLLPLRHAPSFAHLGRVGDTVDISFPANMTGQELFAQVLSLTGAEGQALRLDGILRLRLINHHADVRRPKTYDEYWRHHYNITRRGQPEPPIGLRWSCPTDGGDMYELPFRLDTARDGALGVAVYSHVEVPRNDLFGAGAVLAMQKKPPTGVRFVLDSVELSLSRR
ncbi:MAG: hypothetical protein JW751_28320 [Polyangiaceae bacterium]|nr:hypothetical protein [Polyangiaceae bacterium]